MRRSLLRRALAVAILATASLAAACVHDISVNDTELPGVWHARLVRGPAATLIIELRITEAQDGVVSGNCTIVQTAVSSRSCTISGTITGDTALQLTLANVNGAVDVVRRSHWELRGSATFEYLGIQQTEPAIVFERVGTRPASLTAP